MKKRWFFAILILVTIFIFLLIIAGVSIGAVFLWPKLAISPSVNIIMPKGRVLLSSGQGVTLIVEAQSSSGINHIDFLVNDQPTKTANSDEVTDKEMLTVFPWVSSKAGIHKLSVIAYDNRGSASLPDHLLVGVVVYKPPEEILDALLQVAAGTGDFAGDANTGSDEGEGIDAGIPIEPEIPEELVSLDIPPEVLNDIQNQLDDAGLEDNGFPQDWEGQPVDLPPTVTLDGRIQGDGEVPILVYSAEAVDDIGLDRFIATYKNPGGDPQIRSVPISGLLTFSFTSSEFMGEDGLYLVTAQAFDNSGQSSEVVSQDFHLPVEEGGQNQGWAEGLIGGFAPILPDLGEVDFPEIRPHAIDDGCLHLSAVEGPMWISLRLAVTCRFEAPPGKVIQFDFEESINPDQGDVSPPGPNWTSLPPRTTLLPGDTFSYLRPSPKCWKKYNYRVGVSYENANTLQADVFNPNVSMTETSIETLPCEESVDESFNFVISDHVHGYSVYWNIPKLAELYQEPNPLEIRMEVQRYSLDLRESETLVERTITRDDVFPIIDEYIDEFPRCREQYYYRLVLAEADSGRVKQTIIKKAPEKFCLVGGAREFVLSIPQFYEELADGTSYLSSWVDFWIPRDWPYQSPTFLVLDFDPGPQIVYRVGYIWDYIEAYNSKSDRVDYIDCGGLPYRAQLMVARGSLGDIAWEHRSEDVPQEDILDHGSTLHLISLPCLPMGSEDVILHATNCDGQPCIKVNWTQALPTDALQRFQADSVLLIKQTFSPDGTHGEVYHTLEHFQTEFLDPNVTPGLTYIYKIYYEFDGHHGPGLSQSIVTPTGEQWDCIVDSPENYRCE